MGAVRRSGAELKAKRPIFRAFFARGNISGAGTGSFAAQDILDNHSIVNVGLRLLLAHCGAASTSVL